MRPLALCALAALAVPVLLPHSPPASASTSATPVAQAQADPEAPGRPINTEEPSISGEAREGETLAGSRGSWESASPTSYSFRWLRCAPACEPTGDEDRSYVVTKADVGARVQFEVTATNAEGSSTATATTSAVTGERDESSAPAKLTRLSPFPVVVITGRSRSDGSVITRLLIRRAPRRARVVIRCEAGGRRACRFGLTRLRIRRPSRTRVRRLEGQFSAGTVIKIFIRKGRTLGKYTRLRIRRNAAPARIDRCLEPGSARPVRCDSS